MCRGFQQNERERLKIKAFYTRLSISCTKNNNKYSTTTLPEFLTLHFLPRINGSLLEINGSNIRPDSPAFMTLYKVLSKDNKGVSYACRDKVTVCEGVRFDVYIGDVKVLRGIFRKDEGQNWKIECKCDDVVEGVKDAEVSVVTEGHVAAMSEKVEMMMRRRRRRCCELEDIPEEREEGSDVCGCSECGGGDDDDDDEGVDGGDEEVEVEGMGVGWAVDVGIWVVCIGVGYLVSRASSYKRLRTMRRFI